MAFSNSEQATGVSSGACDWLFGHPDNGYNRDEREQRFRKLLNMEPQDIMMQGGYLTDANEFGRDPVKWVHKQIEKQRSLDNE